MFRQGVVDGARAILQPVVTRLVSWGVTANGLTMAGFLLSLVAGTLFAGHRFGLGALVLTVSGLCDALDGSVARASGRSSRAGAFLDSTVDRYSELAVYLGLQIHYLGTATSVAALLAMAGAAQVSYARARAEGLGEECKVGWFQRPERTVALIAGGLAGPAVMGWVLWVLAILTNITAVHRMLHVGRRLSRKNSAGDAAAPAGGVVNR
jgi:CDP-diacylglycerol---glycerol-3-phosphate 3-phosphatidyltransferase